MPDMPVARTSCGSEREGGLATRLEGATLKRDEPSDAAQLVEHRAEFCRQVLVVRRAPGDRHGSRRRGRIQLARFDHVRNIDRVIVTARAQSADAKIALWRDDMGQQFGWNDRSDNDGRDDGQRGRR